MIIIGKISVFDCKLVYKFYVQIRSYTFVLKKIYKWCQSLFSFQKREIIFKRNFFYLNLIRKINFHQHGTDFRWSVGGSQKTTWRYVCPIRFSQYLMCNTDFSLRRPIANFQRTKKSHLTSSSDTITRTIFVENYAESPWIFSDIKSPEFFNFIFDI